MQRISLSANTFRITPACAGKSLIVFDEFITYKDHPCVCREKLLYCGILLLMIGSPLRVQGKEKGNKNESICSRITPACAGKSEKPLFYIKVYRDHPCVCREKPITVWRPEVPLGSPLRVQGKVVLIILAVRRIRITPACAGKRYLKPMTI